MDIYQNVSESIKRFFEETVPDMAEVGFYAKIILDSFTIIVESPRENFTKTFDCIESVENWWEGFRLGHNGARERRKYGVFEI